MINYLLSVHQALFQPNSDDLYVKIFQVVIYENLFQIEMWNFASWSIRPEYLNLKRPPPPLFFSPGILINKRFTVTYGQKGHDTNPYGVSKVSVFDVSQ